MEAVKPRRLALAGLLVVALCAVAARAGQPGGLSRRLKLIQNTIDVDGNLPSNITAVRLVNGTAWSGRLEVQRAGMAGWLTVCKDPQFAHSVVRVACRQLGYASGGRPVDTSRFGVSTGLLLWGVVCGGAEGTLAECSISPAYTSCSLNFSTGVECFGRANLAPPPPPLPSPKATSASLSISSIIGITFAASLVLAMVIALAVLYAQGFLSCGCCRRRPTAPEQPPDAKAAAAAKAPPYEEQGLEEGRKQQQHQIWQHHFTVGPVAD